MKTYPEKSWNCTDGMCKHSDALLEKEGVYVLINTDLITQKSNIIYVGRSLNLKARWKSHQTYNNAWKEGYYPSVKWKYCSNSAELESKLIKRFQPIYNKQLK